MKKTLLLSITPLVPWPKISLGGLFLIVGLISLESMGQGNFSKGPGFFSYSPRSEGQFPRNDQVRYRGTNDSQINLARAIKALLDDPTTYVESRFFSAIKLMLMKQAASNTSKISRKLMADIQSAIDQNGGRAFDENQAAQVARTLVDKTFDFYEKEGFVEDTYLNYRSGNYVDWPTDAIFTTTVSPAAATYGDRVLVVQELSPRSLDLNFWNLKKNGTLYDHTRDVGEFISHGYIPARDIIGYQVRQSASSGPWHSIEFGVYRDRIKNNSFLLIISGRTLAGNSSSCIAHDAQGHLVHCSYRAGTIALEPPKLTSEFVQVQGVALANNVQPDLPCVKKKLQSYRPSPETPSSQLMSALQKNGLTFIPLEKFRSSEGDCPTETKESL